MKYRIVTDRYAGFECQYKVWWWPFWCQLNGVNTNISVRQAKEEIRKHKERMAFKPEVVREF